MIGHDWHMFLSHCARSSQESAVRGILTLTQRPEIISFAGGLPAAELFPTERFIEAAQTVLTEHGQSALQYTVTEGNLALRNFVADYMKKQEVQVGPENVLICGGSQQGIDLLGRVFIDPGDTITLESPSFLGAIQAFRTYQPKFVSVPMDDQGMCVETLKHHLERHPIKLVYVIPNYQNPSGISLTRERRKELIRLAQEHSFILVEDDPYFELSFESKRELSLLALGQQQETTPLTAYLGTFSKILAPGLRLGWVVAPEAVIEKLVQAKQASDLHESPLLQMMTAHVLQEGFLDKHVALLRKVYQERRDYMLQAMADHFPPGVSWTRPRGGLFIWVTLPPGYDATKILMKAISAQVAFVPGADFHVNGLGQNTLRLSFSSTPPEQIVVGIRRLGELFKQEIR